MTKAEGKKGKTTLFTSTVTLSAAYDQPVTMSYQTVNGTARTSDNDYIAKSGTLTCAPGETTKTITIEVKGDSSANLPTVAPIVRACGFARSLPFVVRLTKVAIAESFGPGER